MNAKSKKKMTIKDVLTNPWVQNGIAPLVLASGFGLLVSFGLPRPLNVLCGLGASIIALLGWIWPRRRSGDDFTWQKHFVGIFMAAVSFIGLGTWENYIFGSITLHDPAAVIALGETFVVAVLLMLFVYVI